MGRGWEYGLELGLREGGMGRKGIVGCRGGLGVVVEEGMGEGEGEWDGEDVDEGEL